MHCRTYDTVTHRKTLIDLRRQWVEEADLVEVQRTTRLNMDFDLKRQLVAVTDVEGVLCAETVPWETADQFEAARDALENWKKSQRRGLKTAVDYADMLAWNQMSPGYRASGSTSQSGRPPLVAAVMRAAVRRQLGLSGGTYGQWAGFLTRCGWPATEQTLKDARRRGRLDWGRISELDDAEREFAGAVILHHPGADLAALLKPDPAATRDLAGIRSLIAEPRGAEVGHDKSADAAVLHIPFFPIPARPNASELGFRI